MPFLLCTDCVGMTTGRIRRIGDRVGLHTFGNRRCRELCIAQARIPPYRTHTGLGFVGCTLHVRNDRKSSQCYPLNSVRVVCSRRSGRWR